VRADNSFSPVFDPSTTEARPFCEGILQSTQPGTALGSPAPSTSDVLGHSTQLLSHRSNATDRAIDRTSFDYSATP